MTWKQSHVALRKERQLVLETTYSKSPLDALCIVHTRLDLVDQMSDGRGTASYITLVE
jgi:hypothetical protein